MKAHNLAIIATICLSLAASCGPKDDPAPTSPPSGGGSTGTLRLELHFVKDSSHFHLSDTLTDGAGNKVRFSRLRFYLSGFSVSAGASVAEFPNAYLLVDASAPSNLFTLGSMNAFGVHRANFTVGLDSAANHADFSQAAPPLNDADMYWSAGSSYLFLVMEGRVDSNGDGEVDATDQAFTYHCATDDMRRHVHHFHIHADVAPGGTGTMHGNVDVARIISGLDLLSNPNAVGGGMHNATAMDSLAVSFEEGH